MNWDAIAAIGEVVGGALLLISIVYLAVQVRQGNRHAQGLAEADLYSGLNQILKDWVSDEASIDAIRRGFGDFDGMSKAQRALFHMKVGALANHWDLARRLHAKRLIADEIHDRLTDLVLQVFSTRGGQQYWEKDEALTPGGAELLQRIRSARSGRTITQALPWWGPD